jgi:PAS domain S-box-containing protein
MSSSTKGQGPHSRALKKIKMNLSLLREWLSWIHQETSSSGASYSDEDEFAIKPFEPEKRLCERDYIIIDMLNSQGHDHVSFCVTDPHLEDNPVIYISQGFSVLTGYDYEDIVGKNCRFLQGPETSKDDVKRISDAIKNGKECSVNLLNYKKDGSTFINEFFSHYIKITYKRHSVSYWNTSISSEQGSRPDASKSGLGLHTWESCVILQNKHR